MGIGFVILIHLIVIFILSVIIAIIGGIITYLVSNKEKRRRKVFFAILVPFVGFYTLYICGIIGSAVVSEKKNVDIGIGDAWYVPLENDCRLLFIDLPEQAFIEKNGQTIVSEVEQIGQNGEKIFGKVYNSNYFSYNTKTGNLKEFDNGKELVASSSDNKFKLMNAYDFYLERKDSIAGNWFIVAGIFSMIISIIVLYLLKLIILY